MKFDYISSKLNDSGNFRHQFSKFDSDTKSWQRVIIIKKIILKVVQKQFAGKIT